jgi:GTPase SAR1 family protein
MSENRSRNLPVRKSDYKFKVTIAGDQHVGKTQILKRIVKATFSSETRATIGIEHSHK